MTQQVQEEQQNNNEEMGYFTPGELVVTFRQNPSVLPVDLIEYLQAALQFDESWWGVGGQNKSLLLRKLEAIYGREHGVYKAASQASKQLQERDLELLQRAAKSLVPENIVPFPVGREWRSQVSLRLGEGNNIYDRSDVLVFLAAEFTLRQQEAVGGRRSIDTIDIIGISPGWRFAGATGGNLISGGPGAVPMPPADPVDANDAQIKLMRPPGPTTQTAEDARKRLARKLQMSSECLEEVDVYVLDTVPPCEHLQRINQQCGSTSQNEWIASLLEGFPADCTRGETEIHGERLHVYYTEQDDEIEIKDNEFEMSDHGFFVAGLIHALAPTATIHLIQVLNDYGAGTSDTLAWGVEKALRMILERGRPAVINCSLTLGIDLDGDGDDDTLENFIAAAQHWLTTSVNETFSALDKVALVVAAAGNDSKAGQGSVLTRFPAAYKQVVGVGALQRDFSRTPYTNVPDNPEWQGFVVFGGELDPDNEDKASGKGGILSVYSAPHFPDKVAEAEGKTGPPNQTGWARWAGTSFATPLVTGLLTQLLGTDMSRGEAMALLRAAVKEPRSNHPHMLPLWQGR